MKKYAFGADIGGTTIKLGLFETLGNLIEVWEIPTRIEENGKYILIDIAASIEEKLKEKKISKLDVEGIGMGVPGPVGRDGNVLKCVNLGWGVFNVEKEMTTLTGFKAKAGNDANVAALGERWKGAGENQPDVVFMTLGTGVGGGVITNGEMVHGAGAGGEIGHINVQPNGYLCTCGNHGCLETYASATGVVRVARDMAEEFAGKSDLKKMLDDGQDISSKIVFDLAKDGDVLAERVVDRVCYYLGFACANIGSLINPSYIVIGGGVSAAGKFLLDQVDSYFKEFAFPSVKKSTTLKLAELGNEAGVIGAASLALKFNK